MNHAGEKILKIGSHQSYYQTLKTVYM